MMSQHEFDLIKGEFEAHDALDLLLGMIQGKINYHNGKAFSLEERYGKDHLNCRDRVKQLTATRQNLEAFISSLEGSNKRLRISSQVMIEVVDQEEEPAEVSGASSKAGH